MSMLLATLTLAALPLASPPTHCGQDRACIIHVARWDCHHWRDRHHCRIARRAEHPDPPPTSSSSSSSSPSFDQCVAFRESSGNPDAVAGPYWGLYQFDAPTWAAATAAMGVAWPYGAATPAEQTAVFDYWSRLHPDAWPNTVPACGD